MILTKRKLAIGAFATLVCYAVLVVVVMPLGLHWLGTVCMARGDVSSAEYFFGGMGLGEYYDKLPGINILPRKYPLREGIARYYIALASDYGDQPERKHGR